VSGERDAGLDRPEAAGAVFAIARRERRSVLRDAPRDAHQRVAVFGEALAADPAAAGHRCGLVAGWGQSGRRVHVLGAGPALDRQGMGGERRGADHRDAGQRRQYLAVGAGEQALELVFERADVRAQRVPALDIAAEALGAELGIPGRRQQPPPARDPEAGIGLGQAPG
jgi:hypothetical protein